MVSVLVGAFLLSWDGMAINPNYGDWIAIIATVPSAAYYVASAKYCAEDTKASICVGQLLLSSILCFLSAPFLEVATCTSIQEGLLHSHFLSGLGTSFNLVLGTRIWPFFCWGTELWICSVCNYVGADVSVFLARVILRSSKLCICDVWFIGTRQPQEL